jgi:hypothetical protein
MIPTIRSSKLGHRALVAIPVQNGSGSVNGIYYGLTPYLHDPVQRQNPQAQRNVSRKKNDASGFVFRGILLDLACPDCADKFERQHHQGDRAEC